MDNFDLAGVLKIDGQLCAIYVDAGTGDCIVETVYSGMVYISNLSVDNPEILNDTVSAEVYHKLMDYFKCDGVMLTSTHIICLYGPDDNYKLEFRTRDTGGQEISSVSEYDLNESYEE